VYILFNRFPGQTEREREGYRKREGEREREGVRERGWKRKRGDRERGIQGPVAMVTMTTTGKVWRVVAWGGGGGRREKTLLGL